MREYGIDCSQVKQIRIMLNLLCIGFSSSGSSFTFLISDPKWSGMVESDGFHNRDFDLMSVLVDLGAI